VKSIRTTTIALVGAALLTLGALTGCSSDDSDDKGKETNASDESKGDSKSDDSKSDSKDSTDAANFDFDCEEYTTVFSSVDVPTNMTDMDAVADYYDALAAEASGGLKNVLKTMADYTRDPMDTAAAERATEASQAWADAVMECAGM